MNIPRISTFQLLSLEEPELTPAVMFSLYSFIGNYRIRCCKSRTLFLTDYFEVFKQDPFS